jgi:photosystem II stability/assembly factor-like uncharacterized protein
MSTEGVLVSTRSTASRLLLAALFYMASANAGVNEFTLTGNDGGYIWAIAAQPGNPNLVLAGTARGIYRSTNGGADWTLSTPDMIGLPEFIAFDPVTPNRVYVLNRQVYVSEDAGQSFAATTAVSTYYDYLTVGVGRVYVGSLNGTISSSIDGGLTFAPVTVPWAAPNARMHTIGADPSNGEVLYACIEGAGTYKTIDHGLTWIPPPAAPAVSPCTTIYNWSHHISVSPADPNRVIIPTSDGIFLSTNGGTSWSRVTTTPFLEFVEFDPHAPNNVFSVDITGRVTRSTDGGATWPFSPTNLNLKVDRVEGASFGGVAGQLYIATPNGPMYSADNGNTFTLRVNGIHNSDVVEVLAADDGTIYAAQSHGVAGLFRRTSGGWVPLDNVELQNLMLNPLNFMDIATSPEDSSLLYVAGMADGLFRSNNGGMDWVGPPPSLTMQVFDIAVDPANPLRAYASKAAGGMMTTVNGGLTFTTCGLSNSVYMRGVVVSRASPNVLYGFGGNHPNMQIYKSSDYCSSWAPISAGLQYAFNHMDINPVDPQDMWVAHYTGVQRSRDGGATWETVQFNFDHDDIVLGFRVLFDPVYPGTVWVLNSNHSGFARSVDDGATWQKVLFPWSGNAGYLQSGVLDPLHPDTLVAGISSYGLAEYQVAPDLAVTLDAPTEPVPTGTSAPATIAVRNNGPLDSSAADITLTLPAFLSAPVLPAGCSNSAGAVRCRVAPVRLNQTATIAVTLVASATPGSGNATISVAGHEADPVSSNNAAAVTVSTARRSDLSVTGPASLTLARTSSADLDFTLTNQGPDMAENARLAISLSAGLQPTTATSPSGSCTVTPGLVICTLGTLNANATTTAQLRVQGMTSGTHVVSAQLLSDSMDTDQDQIASTPVVVQPSADLSMEITAPAGTKTAGTPFQYTATIRNAGPDTATPRAEFTIAGATITTATATQGLCLVSGANVSCNPGDIASGASATVTLTVNPAAAGTATAEATVSFPGADATSTNDRATLSSTVEAAPPPSGGGGSSGGGGGGGLDWLALALLAGALARRLNGA